MPLSTPGPQADRGPTAGRQWSHGTRKPHNCFRFSPVLNLDGSMGEHAHRRREVSQQGVARFSVAMPARPSSVVNPTQWADGFVRPVGGALLAGITVLTQPIQMSDRLCPCPKSSARSSLIVVERRLNVLQSRGRAYLYECVGHALQPSTTIVGNGSLCLVLFLTICGGAQVASWGFPRWRHTIYRREDRWHMGLSWCSSGHPWH